MSSAFFSTYCRFAVHAVMANVCDAFVSMLGRTAVCNYITTANAACAELRAAGRQGVIKQDFMSKLRIPALLAHKQWTIAKIFQVILLLDVLNGVLVTRGVFPWQADPNKLPTRVANGRKKPHPASATCPPLGPSDVRLVPLQSTPTTRGRNAPSKAYGVNNEIVWFSVAEAEAELMLILCWALHREHISIDPALVNQLESKQRTRRVQEDVAQQLCWWAKQVRRTGTTWESLYRHVVRTDEVPSSSAPAPKLAAGVVQWERVRVVDCSGDETEANIVCLADNRRATVPFRTMQAGKTVVWLKRALKQLWTGDEFTTRSSNGFFPVHHKDALSVVQQAGVELSMLRVRQSEERQRADGVVAEVAAQLLAALGRAAALAPQQQQDLARQLRTAEHGPMLQALGIDPDEAPAAQPTLPLLPRLMTNHPVPFGKVNDVYGRHATAMMLAYHLDALEEQEFASKAERARVVLEHVRQPREHVQSVLRLMNKRVTVNNAPPQKQAYPTELCNVVVRFSLQNMSDADVCRCVNRELRCLCASCPGAWREFQHHPGQTDFKPINEKRARAIAHWAGVRTWARRKRGSQETNASKDWCVMSVLFIRQILRRIQRRPAIPYQYACELEPGQELPRQLQPAEPLGRRWQLAMPYICDYVFSWLEWCDIANFNTAFYEDRPGAVLSPTSGPLARHPIEILTTVQSDERHEKQKFGQKKAKVKVLVDPRSGRLLSDPDALYETTVKFPGECRMNHSLCMRRHADGRFVGLRLPNFDYTGCLMIGPVARNN